MPELPEVETIARFLREGHGDIPSIIGRIIDQPHLLWAGVLEVPTKKELLERLPGQRVTHISRRGKFIQIRLDSNFLFIHLRMSGDIRVEKKSGDIKLHDRFLLDFQDDYRLVFNDTRKFGRIWLASDPQQIVGNLGPEPFDPFFTPEVFFSRLHLHSRHLKPLLLDQHFLAGMGNIYTDEALHMAHLHPGQVSDRLTFAQASVLFIAIRNVLQDGIDHNGASIDWVYRGGEFQNRFQVYHRTGSPCLTCGTPISRILVGQRSTHFCPSCQVIQD
jgi:formamidopyrimidine-DNA glycosylase